MPKPAPANLPETRREGAAAIYLPACINRIFGPDLPGALVRVSERAGVPLWIPDDVAGHCCSVPWSSKGLKDGTEWMAGHTSEAVKRWAGEDGLPVVIDASSCAHGLTEILEGVTVLDSIEWVHDRVLPGLEIPRKAGAVAVHPPCSTRHMELVPKLRAVAEALAEEVVVPTTATCCGFAGDRGFLHPELTRAATQPQKAEVDSDRFDAHLSSNRTCEIGLEQGTGRSYESFVYLLDRLTAD
jgi:D-lactate dehydrogenase